MWTVRFNREWKIHLEGKRIYRHYLQNLLNAYENEDCIWKEKGFAGIICKDCGKPMVVLIDHRKQICSIEQNVVDLLAYKYFRLLEPTNWREQVSQAHWHEHYI